MSRRPSWPPDELARLASAYENGVSENELLRTFPGRSRGAIRGRAIKLQLRRPVHAGARLLSETHPAIIDGRTLFPGRVREIGDAPAVLTPGEWQRKLGGMVTKGAWAGMPIFALTLEERATCPSSCGHFRSCMGNGMQMAWRHRHGPELEARVEIELSALQLRHPGGFVVRLHILGDFYSAGYVRRWARWLARFPALRVFGYTAWPPSTPIGGAVARLARARWSRFAIRLSSDNAGAARAITLWQWPSNLEPLFRGLGIIVCPQELGKTKGCGTCGLCWSPAAQDKTIAFIVHGAAHKKWSRPDLVERSASARPTRDEAAAAIATHGSQRAAAASLGVSLGMLQRAAK